MSADPVIWLANKKKPETLNKKTTVIIPRHNSNEAFLDVVRDNVRSFVETPGRASLPSSSHQISILSLQPNDIKEQKMCSKIAEMYKQASIIPIHSLQELIDHIAGASLVIT